MIKYRTSSGNIEAIEVLRETSMQIVLPTDDGRGRRENKSSEYYNWHDTWEDAHSFLVSKAERRVVIDRTQLEISEGVLVQIKGMKKWMKK